MFDMHHIIIDGTSMGIITGIFSPYMNGIKPPELKIQYKDFTHGKISVCNQGKY
jgi:hypothetical protein